MSDCQCLKRWRVGVCVSALLSCAPKSVWPGPTTQSGLGPCALGCSSGCSFESSKVRTRSTTTRDRNLQFRDAVSTGFLGIFSSGFFPLSPGLLCNLVRKSPQNVEKIARFPGGEKGEESCHVSGCHGFFGPEKGFCILCMAGVWLQIVVYNTLSAAATVLQPRRPPTRVFGPLGPENAPGSVRQSVPWKLGVPKGVFKRRPGVSPEFVQKHVYFSIRMSSSLLKCLIETEARKTVRKDNSTVNLLFTNAREFLSFALFPGRLQGSYILQ